MPSAVHVHLQLRIVGDDGTVFTDCEILRLVKSHHQLEAVGLSIGESKSLQECLQQHIVTAQAAAFVDRHRCCPAWRWCTNAQFISTNRASLCQANE